MAFIEVDGVRRYLGEYGSGESHRRYAAALAEWDASGCVGTLDPRHLRVLELVDRYWHFTQRHYCKPDGTPTSEQDLLKRALSSRPSMANCRPRSCRR